MAYLDGACLGRDAQIAGEPDRFAARLFDNGIEQRVVAGRLFDKPGAVLGKVGKRAIGKVGPIAPLGIEAVRRVQRFGMALGVERFEPALPAGHRLSRGFERRSPALDAQPNRLAKGIEFKFRHRSTPFLVIQTAC